MKPRFVFAETFRSFFQNYLKMFGHFFILGHFCMSENGIIQIDQRIFSHFKKLRSVTEKSPKQQVETQSMERFLIFQTTPLVVRCVTALPLLATALYFIQSNPCFSVSSFNLTKMAWAVEQTPTFKTAQLANGFCFLIGKPTTQKELNLFWNICCFIELNTKQLSFLQLVKKLFQQIFWNMKTPTLSCIV